MVFGSLTTKLKVTKSCIWKPDVKRSKSQSHACILSFFGSEAYHVSYISVVNKDSFVNSPMSQGMQEFVKISFFHFDIEYNCHLMYVLHAWKI